MKQLTYLFAFLLGITPQLSWSQQVQITQQGDFFNEINTLFANLNLNQLHTGLLLDKSYPCINVQQYTGTMPLDDSNWADIDNFGFLYATLYGASINASQPILPNPSSYMNVAQTITGTSAEIPFAFMLYDYEQFKENALTDGLLKYDNGQFFEVPYIPVSPYEQKTAFMATPTHIRSENKDVVFTFPSSLFFTNYPNNAIASLEMDFGNGYELITLGGYKRLTWSSGQKEIKIRCTLTNHQILESHAVFYVENNQATNSFRAYNNTPDDTIIIKATPEHGGMHGDIFYACNSGNKLLKPFIVIDGIDPPQNASFHTDFNYLFGLLNNVKYPTGSSTTLEDLLQQEGYDIIYLDYDLPFGSDFIERNALAVEEAIAEINRLKAEAGSTEPNIVMGISQGAVVGKYALLEMQQKNIDSDVKTFMNLDGPMNGANIPLGAQHLVKQVVNLKISDNVPVIGSLPLSVFVPALSTLKSVFAEPSVEQLLNYQAFSSDIINPKHKDFYAKFSKMGKLKCEYICVSNGSSIGQGQLLKAGDELIKIDVNHSNIISTFLPSSGGFARFIIKCFAIGFNTRIAAEMSVFALPDHNKNPETIYHGCLKVKILGFKIIKDKITVKVSDTQPYDSCPGSTFWVPLGIVQNVMALSPIPVGGFISVPFFSASFIPTTSSLDIKAPENEDLFRNFSDVNSVVLNFTALRDYHSSIDNSIIAYAGSGLGASPSPVNEHNQEHATFNAQNAPFFVKHFISNRNTANTLYNIGSLSLRTYNFGDDQPFTSALGKTTQNVIRNSIKLMDQGNIWVNRNDLVGFTDISSNPPNFSPFDFTVFVRPSGCDDKVVIDVDNNGEFRVGDNSVNNHGTVNFFKNTSLSVNKNGAFFIEKGSKVFIQGGASINLQSYSNTLLEGSKIVVQKDALLNVYQYANLSMSDNSSIVIEKGGVFHLYDVANLSLINSKIIIKSGAILQIHNGANLDLSDKSSIVIEKGGRLIIGDDKAKTTNEITIRGNDSKIIIDGIWEVYKNQIRFEKTNNQLVFEKNEHLATFQADLNIIGSGRDIDNIRVGESTRLFNSTGTAGGLNWSDVGVVYSVASTIILTQGKAGGVKFKNINFHPEKANLGLVALRALLLSPTSLIIDDCHFEDFRTALFMNNTVSANAPNVFQISRSVFHNYSTTALEIYKGGKMNILDCKFSSDYKRIPPADSDDSDLLPIGAIAPVALWIDDAVARVTVSGCDIEGTHEQDDFYQNNLEMSYFRWGGITFENPFTVYLNHVPRFMLQGNSLIHDAYAGILAEKGSNIFMESGATLQDNGVGIYISGSVYIFNQPIVTPDFGMVTMDCARLIRNGNGIAGDMVTLNIDEGINSNNTHVNTFINYRGNQTGYLFNISYDNSSANTLGFDCQNLDQTEILATHNYWDKGCPLAGIDYQILTKNNINNLHYGGLLYTDPIIPSAPNDCPTAIHPLDQVDLTEIDDPTKQGVINIDEKQYVTLKQYWTAWQAFVEEKDDEASKWFAPLAAVTREQHDKMENRYAQHYIDVAKVMTTATGYLDGLGADTKGQNPKDLTKNFWITDAQRGELGETIYLSPNPTLNETVLNLVAAHYHIQVIDVYGNVIDKRDSKGHEVFQTETWKPGLYFIEVQEDGSERILTGKLMVTKE